MGNRLYVGNLPFSIDDSSLESVFAEVGNVESSKVIVDRDTGRSRGFGFIEMATDQEAADAISKLNGTSHDGRDITVAEAKPRAPRDNSRGGRH